MIEEVARHRCLGDDGSIQTVIAYSHVFVERGGDGTRRRPGARWLALLDGEPVAPIGADAFLVVATGEVLSHDRDRCRCEPRPDIQLIDGTPRPSAEAA